jgi:hypothetical protein
MEASKAVVARRLRFLRIGARFNDLALLMSIKFGPGCEFRAGLDAVQIGN